MGQISFVLLLAAVMTLNLTSGFTINQVIGEGGRGGRGEGGSGEVPDAEKDKKWAEHKKKHGVKCAGEVDCAVKKANYETTDDMINQHNAEAAQGKHTYTIDHNAFSHMSDDERQGVKGLGVPSSGVPSYGDAKAAADKKPAAKSALPTSIDWRNVSDVNYVNPVEDQGQCGSCWTFSATAALESHWAIKRGELVKLSEQNLVDCCNPPTGGGCSGGFYTYAWQYAASNSSNVLGGQSKVGDKSYAGQNYLADYAYTATEGTCSFTNNASEVGLTSWSDVTDAYVWVGQQHNDYLIRALAEEGPVSVAIDASKKFMQYSSGIFQKGGCKSAADKLDHAVVVIGYGSENGSDYWIVRNSWAASWGDDGYVRLERESGNEKSAGTCGLLHYPVYPNVQ